MTLHAACRVFNVQFLVLNASDESHSLLVSSNELNNIENNSVDTEDEKVLCVFGYYAENKSSHYVSLQVESNDSFHALEMHVKQTIQSRKLS